MKILNLVNLEKSDIKYKISKFPDGQQNIWIDENNCYGFKYNNIYGSVSDCIVKIKSRFPSKKLDI